MLFFLCFFSIFLSFYTPIKSIEPFIPKGQDISKISEERIYEIQEALNNRPRKELGYLTPNEVHSSTFSELIKV